MKIIFLGCTKFSEKLLASILDLKNTEIKAIFSIPEQFRISYSNEPVINTNYADLSIPATEHKIPFYEVDSVPGKKLTDYKRIIEEAAPDVILVLGWYYMVPASIRALAKMGAWGIHASLLPKYAGGAPLVWAILEGEKTTGITLFRLEDGVDDGDIIKQKSFLIDQNDTIKEVYEKATELSKEALTETLSNPDKITFSPQDKANSVVYPQRNPADGEINWEWDADRIHNFIRAQTRPYPGAWTTINNKKVIIWSASIETIK